MDIANKKIEPVTHDDKVSISDLERKRIMESINRSDTDKFLLFIRLMKVHFTLKSAVIIK